MDEVAEVLSKAVNVASKNPTLHQAEQYRYSENYGGGYYLFEVLGTTLTLVHNGGEVEIPERSNWPYYIVVDCEGASHDFLRSLSIHLARLLSSHDDLKAEVDDLSA